MQIKNNEKPPIWDDACKAFQINFQTTIFTYGDTIYNPAGGELSKDLIVHEEMHCRQQLPIVVNGIVQGRWLAKLDDNFSTNAKELAEQAGCSESELIESGAALWWGKYLRDPEFRLSQEVEAYAKQYKYICERMTKNKQTQFTILKRFAEILSGPLYGRCVGLNKALALIRDKSYVTI